MVIRVISLHVMKLDMPGSIHPRFHIYLLRQARQDPAPRQRMDDSQSPPLKEENKVKEWEVKEILYAH